jgi:hypothetical protein
MTVAAMGIPNRAEMWYAGSVRQGRWSVAFRILLGIPHYFVLFFLFIAMFFVAVIGWFAALFTGRLPLWASTYMSGVIRWDVRVNAYVFLLTDRYPPFSFDDESYPARPFPPPEDGPLNRWAVLFRVFLFIPASAFESIVQYGLTFPLLIVTWFIVLIQGEMPLPLYGPYSALVRYHLRAQSYFFMLTSEYPWGMLGDRAAAASPASRFAAPPPSSTVPSPTAPPPPFGAPGSQPPSSQPYSYPTEQGPASTSAPSSYPGAAGQPSTPAAVPPPPPPPSGFGAMPPPPPGERGAPPPGGGLPDWARLVLTGSARGWMIFAIVWGSILFGSQGTIRNAVNSNNNNMNMYAPAPAPPHDTYT